MITVGQPPDDERQDDEARIMKLLGEAIDRRLDHPPGRVAAFLERCRRIPDEVTSLSESRVDPSQLNQIAAQVREQFERMLNSPTTSHFSRSRMADRVFAACGLAPNSPKNMIQAVWVTIAREAKRQLALRKLSKTDTVSQASVAQDTPVNDRTLHPSAFPNAPRAGGQEMTESLDHKRNYPCATDPVDPILDLYDVYEFTGRSLEELAMIFDLPKPIVSKLLDRLVHDDPTPDPSLFAPAIPQPV